MKIAVLMMALAVACATAWGQKGLDAYQILRLPASAHAAALGGANISLIEDDATLALDNPALLATVADRTLAAGYSSYLAGSKSLGASYVMAVGERHTVGLSASLTDYGSMDETNEAGVVTGSFAAKDMLFGARYSYLLSDRWVGGAALKMIYSRLGGYSSSALAVDVGLNYYDEYAGTSVSVLLKNVGVQLSKFEDASEDLPYDLQVGLTHHFVGSPFRVSVTMTDLVRWSSDYYYRADASEGEESFGKRLFNHFVFGVDVLASERLYFSAGYNVRRARELKAAGSSHGAGLSLGAGLQLERFKLGLAYAKYHVSASSVMVNFAYVF